MQAARVHTPIFSPTGTTRKIVRALAQGLGGEAPVVVHDLTYPTAEEVIEISADSIAIIGAPVYAGRVAPLAAERLRHLRGDKTPAVAVVVYGNREYEDALVELRDIAESCLFEVIACCCFIGEHSFSSAATPIAEGRPDANDLRLAVEFGKQIKKMLEQPQAGRKPLQLPGNIPYTADPPNIAFTPGVDEDVCTLCGVCEPMCPGGAITIDARVNMAVERCIHCCACIKICPVAAIRIQAQPLLEKRKWLHENCAARKEPQLFL